MTQIEKVMQSVDDPALRLVGAKIVFLLNQIVVEGRDTEDNREQLQLFAEDANLGLSAVVMIGLYKEVAVRIS